MKGLTMAPSAAFLQMESHLNELQRLIAARQLSDLQIKTAFYDARKMIEGMVEAQRCETDASEAKKLLGRLRDIVRSTAFTQADKEIELFKINHSDKRVDSFLNRISRPKDVVLKLVSRSRAPKQPTTFVQKLRGLSDRIAKPKSKEEGSRCFMVFVGFLCFVAGLSALVIFSILLEKGILIAVAKTTFFLFLTIGYVAYFISADDPFHAMGRAILGAIIVIVIIGLVNGPYEEERWSDKWGEIPSRDPILLP
jgi:hypothetical protein